MGENVTITKTVNIETVFNTDLATYDSVTIDDLGGGGGIIDVSVACLLADGVDCTGSNVAVGSYDRSVDRTFTFDVTFTRMQLATPPSTSSRWSTVASLQAKPTALVIPPPVSFRCLPLAG